MSYYIDKEIYYQNKLQPPRKIKCYFLDIKDGEAYFYDEDGNLYIVPEEDIINE